MAKLKAKRGEVIHHIELSQPEINAIFYALEVATEADDTYDIETHDYLEGYFGDLYCEVDEANSEEGPEEYSGYLTTTSVRDNDEDAVVFDLSEAFAKDRERHGEDY